MQCEIYKSKHQKMSIVSRIKLFLSENGIANSIFADKCEIPRPSVSQLLNGRNKKVSDDVLTKIHLAYPELSMMWLMFGEGDMCVDVGQNVTTARDAQPRENSLFQDELDDDVDYETTSQSVNPVAEVLQSLSKNLVKKQDGAVVENSGKRIVNVMVFYSDSSFDSFVPNK